MKPITVILAAWAAVTSALPVQASSGVAQMTRYHVAGRDDLIPDVEFGVRRHHTEAQDDLMPDVES